MEISRYCKFSTFCKYLIPRSRCFLSNRENIESLLVILRGNKKNLAYKKEITVNVKYKRMISTVLICFKNYFIFKIQCIDKYMY